MYPGYGMATLIYNNLLNLIIPLNYSTIHWSYKTCFSDFKKKNANIVLKIKCLRNTAKGDAFGRSSYLF